MEANLFSWRFRQRREEGPELLVKIAQLGVVHEKRLVDLGKTFLDSGIRGELPAHFKERADHEKAHLNRALTAKNIRCLQRAVLGESIGTAAPATVPRT